MKRLIALGALAGAVLTLNLLGLGSSATTAATDSPLSASLKLGKAAPESFSVK